MRINTNIAAITATGNLNRTENKITAIYMKNNRWHDSHGCGQTGINFEKIVMASLK